MDERARMWRLAAPFAAIGIEVSASVVVGALLGHGFDVWRNASPVGFLLGTGLGCVSAGRAIARLVRFQRRQEAEARKDGRAESPPHDGSGLR